jgi:hypothetical protein
MSPDDEVTVAMPLQLTPGMIQALRNDPLTSTEDKEMWHSRLGWLICAYEVLIKERCFPTKP